MTLEKQNRFFTMSYVICIVLCIFIAAQVFAKDTEELIEFSGNYDNISEPEDNSSDCLKALRALTLRVETLEREMSNVMKYYNTHTSDINNQDKEIHHNGLSSASEKPVEVKNSNNPTVAVANDTRVTSKHHTDSVGGNATNATQKQTHNSEKQRYDIALVALKDGNLDKSEALFAEFIEKYPQSTLLGNAYFWYGETFFKKGITEKAAINYLKCYKKFPKGVKAADALLKLALSLGDMKKNKEACAMLAKLESEFKDRPASSIKRAKDAKNKYGCKF